MKLREAVSIASYCIIHTWNSKFEPGCLIVSLADSGQHGYICWPDESLNHQWYKMNRLRLGQVLDAQTLHSNDTPRGILSSVEDSVFIGERMSMSLIITPNPQ